MAWIIKFTESSSRQLKKLDKTLARRVIEYLDERVAVSEDPRTMGKNLTGPKMGSYWRYRVGDVRVVCELQDQQLIVLVLEVAHRREVYR